MSKKSREAILSNLSRVLDPPSPPSRRRGANLDGLLNDYSPPEQAKAQPAETAPPSAGANTTPSSTRPSTGPSTSTSTPPSPGFNAPIESSAPTEVAPRRDFHKVANSITRVAIPAGMFTGKAKQLYDCLYSLTRGAIVPTRSVRIAKSELMNKAGIGSKVTLDQNIRRLEMVGLITVETIGGIQGGNQYTVFLPEEAATLSSTPPSTGTRSPTPPSPPTGVQKLDPLPLIETTPPSRGLSVDSADTSGEAKTLIKTNTERADDEAFAGMFLLLRKAAEEVTGKGTSAAERERWNEVAELLITELKVAASRTTVTSAPAFLAEHLRRRLRKADARQIEREVGEASTKQAAGASKPELNAEQIQEQVNLMAGLMREGAEMRELEEQFASNFRPSQWHMIRSIALAQAGVPSAKLKDSKS